VYIKFEGKMGSSSYWKDYENRLKQVLQTRKRERIFLEEEEEEKVQKTIPDFMVKRKNLILPSYKPIIPQPIDLATASTDDEEEEEREEEEEGEREGGFITREDKLILSGVSTQYNDTIINVYADLLQKEQLQYFGFSTEKPRVKPEKRLVHEKIVVVFTTFMYEQIVSGDMSNAMRYCNHFLRNIDLVKAFRVVFPINISNYHWVVVVVEHKGTRKYPVMTYYDSCISEDTSVLAHTHGHEIMYNIEQFFNHYRGLPEDLGSCGYIRTVFRHSYPQTDGCSCGVYVCHRMKTAVVNRMQDELIDVMQFRTYMKRRLLS
jgi:hypothetical protein